MKAWPIVLLAGAALCFALALADQLSSGDVYQRSSSLRTDRDGSSAYFEALAKTRARVERNYAPLDVLAAKGGAVLLLGVPPRDFGEDEFIDTLTALARAGSRIVITVYGSDTEVEKPKNWNIAIRHVASKKGNNDDEEDEDAAPWPEYFEPSTYWRVFRSEAGRAVAVERTFGAGSIALVAATHPFLNLALRDNRDLGLLEWATGDRPLIVFDETHLGSSQSGTIMGLLRRFRLQGLLAALGAASLLFFWRASAPFPPVPEAAQDSERKISGTGSGEALRNLLERRISPSALIQACIQEWTRDFARRAGSQKVMEVSKAVDEKTPVVEQRVVDQWERIRGIVRGVRTRTR
jgi:hypothetical protein